MKNQSTAIECSDQDLITAGDKLRKQGRWSKAAVSYCYAIRKNQKPGLAWLGLGLTLKEREKKKSAILCMERHLKRKPDSAYGYFMLGWLYYADNKFETALKQYRRAITINPNYGDAIHHAGASLHELQHFDNAISHYRKAMRILGETPVLLYHMGKALKDSGRLEEAIPWYERSLSKDPQNPYTQFSLGLLHLLRGDYRNGWERYELRWQGWDRAGIEKPPNSDRPQWTGEPVKEESAIIVYAEQGFGDSIQLIRYYRKLSLLFEKVCFVVQSPLYTLFRQNLPEAVEIRISRDKKEDETGFTHHIPMLSLPGAFNTTLQDLPIANRYLVPDPARVKKWQERVSGDKRIKIGLVWNGGALTSAPERDIDFNTFETLFKLNDIHWVSLQLENKPTHMPLISDWMTEVKDFSDTAALIASLDLVIGVDTAVAHLAGALGKPVWLMNRFTGDWRWMIGREDSPWYPSMRIFRQPKPGDWKSVIDNIREALLNINDPSCFSKKTHAKSFLHLQYGQKPRKTTIRGICTNEWRERVVATNKQHGSHILGQMNDLSGVPDVCLDVIFSTHYLEHLYPHEVPKTFLEFKRILKADGYIVIACPDLQSTCARIAKGNYDDTACRTYDEPATPLEIIYGKKSQLTMGDTAMAHRSGLTQNVLIQMLKQSGFSEIVSMRRCHPHYDLFTIATKRFMGENELRALAKKHFPAPL